MKQKNPCFHKDFSAGEEGIEPPLTVLETAALPLYYSPILLADFPPPKKIITYSNAVSKKNFTTIELLPVRCLLPSG